MAPDPTLHFDLPSGHVSVARSSLQLVGRGGISSVYGYSRGGEHYAVKLFNRPERAPWDKITLLTQTAGAAPNPQYVIGWPTAIVTAEGGRAGIVLPLFPAEFWCPLDHWVEFHLAAKLPANSGLITARIHILNNCAAALADLHERGCAVVDLKPSNILVNRATFQVAFIDVDSYRVERNGTVYPATHISPGYILPRAIGETIDVAALGREQDRYAFAVIVFQMLNFGTHPYQGVLTGPTEGADTNDEKAKRRLYAYGAVPSMMIQPLKQSVHLCWPMPLRDRLEAALTREDGVPSAKDWADYFSEVLQSKQFERCTAKPDDVRHIRFLGLPCMACAREAVIPRPKLPKLPPLPPGGPPPSVPPPLPRTGNSVWKMVGGIAAAVVGLAVLAGRLAPMLQNHPYRPAQPIGFLPAPPPASIMFKRVIAWTRLIRLASRTSLRPGSSCPGRGWRWARTGSIRMAGNG